MLYWFVRFGLTRVRVGLFCETYPDLQDRQISKINTEFPLWLGQVKETDEDGLCFFLRPEYGSGIICLRNLDKPAKYQSAEFAAIAVDELTKNTEEKFHILRGSLRWPGIEHTVFLGATNPGGIGHEFVKRYWIDRRFPAEMQHLGRQFHFIKALPKDNPFLSKTYWEDLKSLPERLRKAWVDGDWGVFEGMAFPAWDDTIHIVDPFDIPAGWPRWRAVDGGFADPFCTLWFTQDPDSRRIFVYRELYATNMTDRSQARSIVLQSPDGAAITYGDPSLWARKNVQDIVTSTADEYAAEGVAMVKADNDRASGKRKVDRVLAKLADGKPGLQVFRNCANLIRTLPSLALKEGQEIVADNQEDHAYDTLRYGLSALTTQVKRETKVQRASRGLERSAAL